MPKIAVRGIELFYELVGPEGAPVVVFSNSVGSAMDIWDGVVPALAGHYRCLRYDTRGHGRSGSSNDPVSIDDLADDLVGLLDALKIGTAHIVGLSLGGMTGQALASRLPDRVRSLTIVASSPHLPPVDFWTKRAAIVRADGPAAVVDQIMPRWFTESFRKNQPDAVARVRASFMNVDVAGYARCCEAIGAMDLRERLAKISAPVLIIVGAEDPVTTPAMADAMRTAIPNALAVAIPGAAHLISVEKPAEVSRQILGFLESVDARNVGLGDAFEAGLAVRKAVLGEDYVVAALDKSGAHGMRWQDFITRVAWGEVWGDPTLPRKTRSLLTLAMMIALHREEEFKLHVRGALTNGATPEEIGAVIRQAAVYSGIPAGNAAMRWTRDILGPDFT